MDARRNLVVDWIDATAGAGYFKIEVIEACENTGDVPHVPKPQRGSTVSQGLFPNEPAARTFTSGLCSVRSGNLASPRAGVYPGAGRSVILVIHESVQTNMDESDPISLDTELA